MRYISFVFLLFSLSEISFAQSAIGVRLGGNFSNQDATVDGVSQNRDNKQGILAGMYFIAPVSEKFMIQPEILFSSMGSQNKDTDVKFQFGYLAVPVFARYEIGRRFHIHAGPQMGVLLTAKVEESGNFVDVKSGFKGIEWGANAGVGAEFGRFDLGMRYYWGLNNLVKESSGDDSLKNFGLQFFIGIQLSPSYDD